MVTGDDEHSLARKRMKIQALITTCIDTSVQLGLHQMHEQEGSWRGSRATAGTWGRRDVDVAPEPASRRRVGARGVRWLRLHADQTRGKTYVLWPTPSFSLPPDHLLHTDCVQCPRGDLTETHGLICTLSKSIARKRNFVSAEVVYQNLRASIS